MAQEEKDLLLKVLCAMLPYDVKGLALGDRVDTISVLVTGEYPWVKTTTGLVCHLGTGQFKPYLRPMLSMTEEEKSLFLDLRNALTYQENGEYDLDDFNELNNFLNKRKLDRYGLIDMGIALEAPKNMYKF